MSTGFGKRGGWQPRGGNSGRGRQEQMPPAPALAPVIHSKKPLKIEGDAALWVTLQRVTDPNSGWTKTTRAMQTAAGVLVNTCSRKNGSTTATEALCLVPGVKIQGGKLIQA